MPKQSRLKTEVDCLVSRISKAVFSIRGVSGRWAGWAIAHPDFGRIEVAAGQRPRAALLLAHPVLGSQ